VTCPKTAAELCRVAADLFLFLNEKVNLSIQNTCGFREVYRSSSLPAEIIIHRKETAKEEMTPSLIQQKA